MKIFLKSKQKIIKFNLIELKFDIFLPFHFNLGTINKLVFVLFKIKSTNILQTKNQKTTLFLN